MTGSFRWIVRYPCPAGTYGERPFPAVGKSEKDGTAASGPEMTHPSPDSWLNARIRVTVVCPPAIASAWSIPCSAISVMPGRIRLRAPPRSAASFFPFSRSVAGLVGRLHGADLPDDGEDVLGLRGREDLAEPEERRDGEDVELESDGGEGDVSSRRSRRRSPSGSRSCERWKGAIPRPRARRPGARSRPAPLPRARRGPPAGSSP